MSAIAKLEGRPLRRDCEGVRSPPTAKYHLVSTALCVRELSRQPGASEAIQK